MKTKLAIVIAAGAILLMIAQYFFLPAWFREPGVKVSGWLIMLSIAVAIALSAVLLNYVIKKLLEAKPFDLFGLSSSAPKGSKFGSYFAAIASYPFGLFLGFVVGGSFGGALGGSVGDVGVVIGIGVGVFIITVMVGVAAVLAGFVLGGFAEKLAR